MTTEEKLEHFQNFCMEDARIRSAKMLDEYMDALERTYAEHETDAKRQADMQLQSETDKIEREINRKLSIEQINLKRVLGQKTDELKEKLFVELRDMIANYLESPEYEKLLDRQIAKAKEFAGDDEFIIYMDPVDENKVRRLALQHNVDIRLSQYSFFGGSRTVIPSKNILIDNSFETKMEEEKHNFKFDLGGKANV